MDQRLLVAGMIGHGKWFKTVIKFNFNVGFH